MTALPARGEVWWCELPEAGRRPVVVLSRDAAIPRLRRALIGPCTTTIRGIPTEVRLEPGDDPVPRVSVVNLDAVESVAIATLAERLGRLGDERMNEICEALRVATGCAPWGKTAPGSPGLRALTRAIRAGPADGTDARPRRAAEVGATGLEPVTPSLSSWCSPN